MSPLQMYGNEFDLSWRFEAQLKTSKCKKYFDQHFYTYSFFFYSRYTAPRTSPLTTISKPRAYKLQFTSLFQAFR